MQALTNPKTFSSATIELMKLGSTLAERIEAEVIDEPNGRRQLTVFFAPWDIEVGTNSLLTRSLMGFGRQDSSPQPMTPVFSSGWTNFEWTDQVALDPTNASAHSADSVAKRLSR